jgi:binding-protein-dependent transport system inner membrane component
VHTVVGPINDDGVVGNTELVDHLEQVPNMTVVFEHAIDVFAETAAALIFRPDMGVEMHARAVPRAEERSTGLSLSPDEVDGCIGRLVVDRLHAFLAEWSGILNGLATDLAKTRVDRSVVLGGGFAFKHAARTELLLERGVFRINYLLPPPETVLPRIAEARTSLFNHSLVTMQEILLGFGLAIVTAIPLSLLIALSPVAKRMLYPLLIFIQLVPKIAIAPLFVVRIGFGIASKVMLTLLLTFFPLLLVSIAGFQILDQRLLYLTRSMGAGRHSAI